MKNLNLRRRSRLAHPDQRSHAIEAGTMGRLIRALMSFAASNPDWRAFGPVETFKNPSNGKTRLRQAVRLREREDT